MSNYQQKVSEFLNQKAIAIAGVSRKPAGEVGNIIYKKLRSAGYNVFAVNPNADEVEGDKCYNNLKSIPTKPDAVFIGTHPSKSINVVKECAELGIKSVWFHRTIIKGTYSKEAEDFCKENGIDAITYGCPMSYIPPVDFGHKCIHFFLKIGGKLP